MTLIRIFVLFHIQEEVSKPMICHLTIPYKLEVSYSLVRFI